MSSKIKTHCVDDDEFNRIRLEDSLPEYDCVLLTSGQACLEAAQSPPPPALILLDVNMPKMDGLETCRKLKEVDELKHIPVIFLSAGDSLNDRLNGYTAGGDDYLTKPFNTEELLAKVKASLKRKELLDNARRDAKDAAVSISDIMTAMGEMSTVVNFFQNTFACKSYEVLAKRIIQAHETLGLEIAIQFIIDGVKQHYNSTGIESSLEESVFEYVRSKGRQVNCGERAAVNYPSISIIIRNMPVDDPDLQGRIRDHIALIAQGADSKIKALKSELLIKSQREELIHIVTQIEKTIGETDNDYKGQQKLSENIFSTVISTLEDSFMALGLTEQQEEYQRSIIETAEEQSINLYNAGLALEDRFSDILEKINIALEHTVNEEADDEDNEEDDISGEAITLF